MAYVFDGVNKVISITSQTVMSVRDVYSRWADWYSASDNSKFLPAFDIQGGQDIDLGSGTKIPIYGFIINGWKIRPQESSHTLNVTDGVLLVQGGGDPFLNTLGNFVVRINYQQPVQAITVSIGGGASTTPAQFWQYIIEAGFSAQDLMKLFTAVLVNESTGNPSSTAFKSIDATKTRLQATLDSQGNRSAISRDVS